MKSMQKENRGEMQKEEHCQSLKQCRFSAR